MTAAVRMWRAAVEQLVAMNFDLHTRLTEVEAERDHCRKIVEAEHSATDRREEGLT